MADETAEESGQRAEDERAPVPDYERREVERLLRVFQDESRGRWPILHVGCVGCMAIPLGLLSVCYSLAGITGLGLGALVIGVAALALLYFATRLSTSRAQKQSLLRLAELNDVRSVPALLTALTWPDMIDYENVLLTALHRLLPQLRASDSSLFSARHRGIMRRQLRNRDADLVVAILRAMEQIGDSADVPAVQRLASMRANNPRRRSIVEAAQQTLPVLLARHERTGETLLRATQGLDSNSLLRPTTPKNGGDSEDLLRPSETDRPRDGNNL